ncbi:hypothetical protein, partial [Mesorhizobium sp. M4B.F.Ca.ET.150.01.1.1]|uniref:hypothetical protein n=1 Tax=Mesorhizobium sp. M4B.F.Ca.ET.150.01.1.1 TaxID=2563948 RepID=UPI001AED9321
SLYRRRFAFGRKPQSQLSSSITDTVLPDRTEATMEITVLTTSSQDYQFEVAEDPGRSPHSTEL